MLLRIPARRSTRGRPHGRKLARAELQALRAVGVVPWTLLATAPVAMWIPLNMLRVAHGDPTAALAVLEASDKPTVVAGLLVLLLPYAVLVLWSVCCFAVAADLGRIRAAALHRPHATESGAKRALLRLLAVSVPSAALGWLLAAAVPMTDAVACLALVSMLSTFDSAPRPAHQRSRRLRRRWRAARRCWRRSPLRSSEACRSL